MRSMLLGCSLLMVLAAFTGGGCGSTPAGAPAVALQAPTPAAAQHAHPHPHVISRMPGPLPTADFSHPPKEPHNPNDYIFKLDQLEQFYKAPGEYGHKLVGADYGFEGLSFILTETQPGGGPALHVHDAEEAHVLMEGSAKYVIGDKTFEAQAPYIAKVPAGVPHTFVNAGDHPFNLVCIFATKRVSSKKMGPNPLLAANGTAPAEAP